ncbi:CPBP family intramembrane glutamic endopeptidase [Aureibacter tunicatorum]|uniref:CAAX prenyl protease 2/Lysostaphin resistance protein A-like domain-containing protein n=1 Tax=Aureibacter tunicatorum TaxID=866807 RepID=A0AAE3XI40_9BACT|nr:CPBP family intramembrane glutamic endopeptidase [Aureibacter tunicatorum]MDR6237258.1 hypothetical protein [Aureibacter tunicatorum]BDD06250.1 hypothetical protein AUTU_37330 [Aureibacter tunicatorum]
MNGTDKNNVFGNLIVQRLRFIAPFLFILAGMLTIGSFLGIAFSLPLMGFDFEILQQVLADPINYPQYKNAILLMQAGQSIGWLFVAPWLYLKYVKRVNPVDYVGDRSASISMVGLTVLIGFSFMIFDSVIVEWNKSLQFPEFMSEFQQWAMEKEKMLEELTKFFTEFSSFSNFAIAFVVIALIAGIGEEYLFRGVLQKHFQEYTKSYHLAIWLAAICFSAIHMQFYGFVPRMLLGALFGYLYYYSGNLIYPIVAHIFNNGLVVTLTYFDQIGLTHLDLQKEESAPIYAVVAGLLISMMGLKAFRAHFMQKES